MNDLILEPLISAASPTLPTEATVTPCRHLGGERRKEIRYATCNAVKVSLADVPELQVPGIVRDVSKSGLRVELALPISTGVRLRISFFRGAFVLAEVRYCRRTEYTYQVGAEIEKVHCTSRTSSVLLPFDSPDSLLETHELVHSILERHISSSVHPHRCKCGLP